MNESAAIALVLMTTGAMIMPSVARKLAVPVAVTEIGFGLLIGPSGVGLVRDPGEPFIRALAELGFAFFLFLAGLEIDFRGFERKGLRSLASPFAYSVLAFGVALGLSLWLGFGTWVGLAMGATAVPLLLSVVREGRLLGTPLGTEMLSYAAMGELVTILLLSLVEMHAQSGGDVQAMAGGLLRLLALCLVVALALLVLRSAVWWFPSVFRRLLAHDDPSELGVRVGFGMMLLFVGLSMLAHLEPFLGAFVAGALLSFVVREASVLEHKLSSMAYGFFVPVFFIHVGMRLQVDVGLLVRNWQLVVTVIFAMLFAKLVPAPLLAWRGLGWRNSLITATLLSAPLTLVIAIMDLGARAGAVTPDVQASVIAGGILASLLYPSIARRALVGARASGGPPAELPTGPLRR